MQRKILTYLCCLMMLFAGVSVFAKKKGPPSPPLQNQPIPPGLPITGDLSYLFIAGVAFGVYAIKKKFTIYD
ncbi:MAG: hypothetical protein RQ864_13310 [Lutibacter sp.]|nr:hypothetical protein [Lutibacter sp.]MDT8418775.1 hypothetical protein [Lutibacter sp.]